MRFVALALFWLLSYLTLHVARPAANGRHIKRFNILLLGVLRTSAAPRGASLADTLHNTCIDHIVSCCTDSLHVCLSPGTKNLSQSALERLKQGVRDVRWCCNKIVARLHITSMPRAADVLTVLDRAGDMPDPCRTKKKRGPAACPTKITAKTIRKAVQAKQHPLRTLCTKLNFSERNNKNLRLLFFAKSAAIKANVAFHPKDVEHRRLWAAAIAEAVGAKVWPSQSIRDEDAPVLAQVSATVDTQAKKLNVSAEPVRQQARRFAACFGRSQIRARALAVPAWKHEKVFELRVIAHGDTGSEGRAPERATAATPFSDRELALLCHQADLDDVQQFRTELAKSGDLLDPIFMPTIHPGTCLGDRAHQANVFFQYKPAEADVERDDDEAVALRARMGLEGTRAVIFLVIPECYLDAFRSIVERDQADHPETTVYFVVYERALDFGQAFTFCQLTADCLGFPRYFQADDDLHHMEAYDTKSRRFRECSFLYGLRFMQRVYHHAIQNGSTDAFTNDEQKQLGSLFSSYRERLRGGAFQGMASLQAHICEGSNIRLFRESPAAALKQWDGLEDMVLGNRPTTIPSADDAAEVEAFVEAFALAFASKASRTMAGVSTMRASFRQFNAVQKHPKSNYSESHNREQLILNNTHATRGFHMIPDELVLFVDEDKRNTATVTSASTAHAHVDQGNDLPASGDDESDDGDGDELNKGALAARRKQQEYWDVLPSAVTPRGLNDEEFNVAPTQILKWMCTNQYRHPVSYQQTNLGVVSGLARSGPLWVPRVL